MCLRLFSQSLCVCVSSQTVLHNSITTVQYTVTEFCTHMLSLSALHRYGPVSKHVHTFRSKCTETKTHTLFIAKICRYEEQLQLKHDKLCS